MDDDIIRPASRIVGSPEYIKTVVSLAARWAKSIDQDCRPFVEQCKKLMACQAWTVFFEKGEKSWERLCLEALKLNPKFVSKILEGVELLEGRPGPIPKDEALNPPGTAGPGRGHKTGRRQLGTSASYFEARLRRDRPDLAAALDRGEFHSPFAAAKAAGFAKDRTPLQDVRSAWKRASPDDKRQIVAWIQDQLQADPDLLDSLG